MKKQPRKPITLINPYGRITRERVERLPEPVQDRLGRLIYAILMRLAEREAGERGAVKLAA